MPWACAVACKSNICIFPEGQSAHALHIMKYLHSEVIYNECEAASASGLLLHLGLAGSKHYLCFLSRSKATALEVICISLTEVTMLL